MAEVTVRELRQNLSVYLRRVEHGETLSVTRRGERVAVLAPLPGRGRAVDRLAAEGRLLPPAGDLLELGPPPKLERGEPAVSEALEELREESG
jgi:prevent-host-death family protein